MALSNDLISQFVKITKDDKKKSTAVTVYGTAVTSDGKQYVRLDGSELLTPVSTTTNMQDGERVTVTISDHTATVTGNITSPAARTSEVKDVADQVSEFEIVSAHTVTAENVQAVTLMVETLTAKLASIENLDVDKLNVIYGEFETLKAQIIEGEKLTVNEITAITATIDSIKVKIGEFDSISAEDLEVINAEITNLRAYTADFTYLSAVKADIQELVANSATIDFANIKEGAFEKIFVESGMMDQVVIRDGEYVGTLVGVKITGDLIEANTLKVDQLVVRGSDGQYYSLNTDFSELGIEPVPEDSIHGSAIVAQSITASKMSVDELAAFGATIGGFTIVGPDSETNTIGAIYSNGKLDVNHEAPGLHLGQDGQISIGDGTNYLRFQKELNEDGTERYTLRIAADSIEFGSDVKSSLSDIKTLTEHVKIGTWVDQESLKYHDVQYDEENDEFVASLTTTHDPNELPDRETWIFEDLFTTDGDEVYVVETSSGERIYVCVRPEINPSVELSEGDSTFKQVITNKSSRIMDGENIITEMDTDGVETENVTIRNELRQGEWVWVQRANGNLGLIWKEVVV